MQANEDSAPIDAFLSYREGEPRVSDINEQIKQHGVRTLHFHNAVKPGDTIDVGPVLSAACCMAVFLGERPTRSPKTSSLGRELIAHSRSK